MQLIETFSEVFRFNAGYLSRSLEKVQADNYYIRPEKRGNPLIWLLGHVIVNRAEIIEILGGNPAIGNLGDLFANGTVPENDPSKYPKPSQLMARFMKLASVTEHLLRKCDSSILDSKGWGKFETVGQNIIFSYMHETHHIGQITYIVNLPGVRSEKRATTVFKKPQEKDSTAMILIKNIKSVFAA